MVKQPKKTNKKDDEAKMAVVNMIWDVYDDDGNGSLDKDETRKFVTDYMAMMG